MDTPKEAEWEKGRDHSCGGGAADQGGPERFPLEREEPNWHAKQAAFNTIYTNLSAATSSPETNPKIGREQWFLHKDRGKMSSLYIIIIIII